LGQAASPKQLQQPPSGNSANLPNPANEALVFVAFKENSRSIRARKEEMFHEQILDQQQREGLRVIKSPHSLGFLDPNLLRREFSAGPKREASAAKPTSAS
jgi:hypothetical protein